jgi:hypothetical protein
LKMIKKTEDEIKTLTELLQSAQFVVDTEGKPTAVVLDIKAWEAFIAMVEDLEEVKIFQDRVREWRTKERWTPWESFVEELEAQNLEG